MKRSILVKAVCFLVLLSVAPMASWADGDKAKDDRKGPPPEAIAACAGKSAGDRVEFKGRRGEMLASTCEEHRGQLVAVPDNMPERGKPRKEKD